MSSPVSCLDPAQLQRDLGMRDLSDPADGPHQLDLWRITRRAMGNTGMDQMIAVLLGALTPGLPCRQQPRAHPYTRHGRQVDGYQDGRWVEVWECGLAHPRVLAAAGLHGRSGRALGMGLDRLLMLVKHIPGHPAAPRWRSPDHPADARPRPIPARLADAPDHPGPVRRRLRGRRRGNARRPGP